jgi:MarR family 2-MHQ and catechol resistance regulon transcriptional repressor
MDRRIIYAELTEVGKARMSEILPNHYQTLAESFAGLNSEEKEQAIGLLKKISFSLTR